MKKQKILLAMVVILPAMIALGLGVGLSSGSEITKNVLAALAMIGLASLQLFVGLIVLGPRGLMNGYELRKTQGQN